MTLPSKVHVIHCSNYIHSNNVEIKLFTHFFVFAVWEIATGRCIKTLETGDIVRSVAWCPNAKISLIAIASGNRLILVNPKVGDKMLTKKTDEILVEAPKSDLIENERIKTAVQWATSDNDEYEKGFRIVITHFKPIRQVTWHGKGDYFATVMPEGANRSTLIHQLSKRRTQIPFSKSKGLVQYVLFHPVKPCLFVAVSRAHFKENSTPPHLLLNFLLFIRHVNCNNFFLGFHRRKRTFESMI